MRVVLTLGMVAALAVLAGCSSSRCRGVATARTVRPARTAYGSASGTYAPAPDREVVVHRVSRPAPARRASGYCPPPAPCLPVIATPCAPAPVACAAPCAPAPVGCATDDPCPGGVCGIPAVEDCFPGGSCAIPSLKDIFDIKLGCK